MPYSVAKNEKGRWQVVTPKGKTWKTTYATSAAADKAIAYIEARFGGTSSPEAPKASATEDASTGEMTGGRGEKTLVRLRMLQDESGF